MKNHLWALATIFWLTAAALASGVVALPLSPTHGAHPRIAQTADDSLQLGPIRLGMSEDEVERMIGEPSERFDPQVDEVTGQHTHATTYSNGATLVFLDDPEVAQPGTLLAVLLDGACDWEGLDGLRLGLEASQARAVLAELIDAGWEPGPSGGEDEAALLRPGTSTLLLIRFQANRVSFLYLGPELTEGP